MDGHEVYTSEEIINLVKDNKIETLRSILSNDADSKILDSTRDWVIIDFTFFFLSKNS